MSRQPKRNQGAGETSPRTSRRRRRLRAESLEAKRVMDAGGLLALGAFDSASLFLPVGDFGPPTLAPSDGVQGNDFLTSLGEWSLVDAPSPGESTPAIGGDYRYDFDAFDSVFGQAPTTGGLDVTLNLGRDASDPMPNDDVAPPNHLSLAAEMVREAFGPPDDGLPADWLTGDPIVGAVAVAGPDGIAEVWHERAHDSAELFQGLSEESPPEHYEFGEEFELRPGDVMQVNSDGSVDIWRAEKVEKPTASGEMPHGNAGDLMIDLLGTPDEVVPAPDAAYLVVDGDALRVGEDGYASIWYGRAGEVAESLEAISEECPPEHYEFGEEFELHPGDAMQVNPDGSVDIWRYKPTGLPPTNLEPPIDSPQLEGDVDSDGAVTLEDFRVLKQNFGQPGAYADGDLNYDATVDLADFAILKMNFGRVSKTIIKREDRDGDGKTDHTFIDLDGDGKWDSVRVDRDGDGKDEEHWNDKDGDGKWDSVHLDKNDDGKVDEIKQDKDGDGNFDYRWRDFDGDGEIDDGEHAPMFFPERINGPAVP